MIAPHSWGFLFVGGWVDLIMGRYITLLLFIGLIFGQDTLKTVSGQILIGKFIKTTAKHIVFQETYEITRLVEEFKNHNPTFVGFFVYRHLGLVWYMPVYEM